MWIRSQDRKVLINVETLHMAIRSVVADTYGSRIKCYNFLVKCNQITLGAYSTEDKSLKVLDMIQKRINEQEEFKAQGTRNIKYKQCGDNISSMFHETMEGEERLINWVFQMPQDSEVE